MTANSSSGNGEEIQPLSSEEKFAMFEQIFSFMRKTETSQKPEDLKNVPLFFGAWSGMNLLRRIHPFYVDLNEKYVPPSLS